MSENLRPGLDRIGRAWRSGLERVRWLGRAANPGSVRDLAPTARGSLGWLSVVVVAAVVTTAAMGSERLGLALAGLVLLVGVYMADPILLAVIVVPGSLLLQRVGGASTNLSAADLLVFMGGLVCLFHVRWQDAYFLRRFLTGIVWYQAVLIIVVMANPNRYDIVEWFHRFSYLGGSVLVGWVIATHHRTRQAFRLFLWGASIIAVISMEQAVSSHFHPAQWGAYQKNSIGAVMWVAVVLAQINPSWTGLARREVRWTKYLCIGGLLASQSRQAAVSLLVALAAAMLLNPEVRRRSKLALLGSIPLIVALYESFSIAARNNPRFNSVSIRVDQISAAWHVWHLSPILGEGMRFYDLPQFTYVTAPPNVLIDNLSSTGIVGSLAFCFLVFVTLRTMFKLPHQFGTLGLAILLAHYTDGLFDIFWIGANMIPPFVIAGVSLGMADAHRGQEVPSSTTAPSPGVGTSARRGSRTGTVSRTGTRTGTGAGAGAGWSLRALTYALASRLWPSGRSGPDLIPTAVVR